MSIETSPAPDQGPRLCSPCSSPTAMPHSMTRGAKAARHHHYPLCMSNNPAPEPAAAQANTIAVEVR